MSLVSQNRARVCLKWAFLDFPFGLVFVPPYVTSVSGFSNALAGLTLRVKSTVSTRVLRVIIKPSFHCLWSVNDSTSFRKWVHLHGCLLLCKMNRFLPLYFMLGILFWFCFINVLIASHYSFLSFPLPFQRDIIIQCFCDFLFYFIFFYTKKKRKKELNLNCSNFWHETACYSLVMTFIRACSFSSLLVTRSLGNGLP